jgi:hypothetical protein
VHGGWVPRGQPEAAAEEEGGVPSR